MFGYTLSAYPRTIPVLQDPTSLVFTCREPSLMSCFLPRDTQLRNPEALFFLFTCHLILIVPDLDDVRAIYYNNKFFGGTRDEKASDGLLVDKILSRIPENTGALALLAFDHVRTSSSYCDVWVCKDLTEEDILEPIIGEVILGATIFGPGDKIIEGSLQKLLRQNKV